jgi:hypothetical protein
MSDISFLELHPVPGASGWYLAVLADGTLARRETNNDQGSLWPFTVADQRPTAVPVGTASIAGGE